MAIGTTPLFKDEGLLVALPAGGRHLSTTLSSVALELQDLAHTADHLQTLISSTVVPGLAGDEAHMRELQAIDLMVQRLQGLATFVDSLSGFAPPELCVDAQAAATGVRLSDLARRLTGGGPDAMAQERSEKSASGEFELFG